MIENKPDCPKMEYWKLRTWSKCYRFWKSGKQFKWWSFKRCFKKALENRINFFDTAEGYGFGKLEIQFGKIIKEQIIPKEKIVIST